MYQCQRIVGHGENKRVESCGHCHTRISAVRRCLKKKPTGGMWSHGRVDGKPLSIGEKQSFMRSQLAACKQSEPFNIERYWERALKKH